MAQRTGNTTPPRSSRNTLLKLAITAFVIAALSGHLVQILRFLLSLAVMAALMMGAWVIIESLSSPSARGSAAPQRGGSVAPNNVRGTPAPQRHVAGRIRAASAQAAPRDGRSHLLVLTPEHTELLRRVDPYTRTSFRVGEQAVHCGGCGNLYKLVTCVALEHRCPTDGASLRPSK